MQRATILKLLRRNPGLKPRLDEAMVESWKEAKDLAIAETDLLDEQFPEICPFSVDQILSPDFGGNPE